MPQAALEGITVVDVAGTVATGFCAKLYADYGATVTNLEPPNGFVTRRLAPMLAGARGMDASAMHAYLSTNKRSVLRGSDGADEMLAAADLVLDAGAGANGAAANGAGANAAAALDAGSLRGVRTSISWFGEDGPYASYTGSDAQCFALNGMLRNIGHPEGPPIIPTGYQAQMVGGISAFIGSMTEVLARELGNEAGPVHLETSILESMMCFTDVGVVGSYTSGLSAPRMGINRFPPTYPLGVFPCRDGWLGVTVLTPSQWRSFCRLLDMEEFSDVALFQTAIGRLQALDIIEPVMTAKLLEHSAEALFYRGQQAAIPLARVPTMEELFGVDQFLARQAFGAATLPDGQSLQVPRVAFRLFATPPAFGGPVARLGEHTAGVST